MITKTKSVSINDLAQYFSVDSISASSDNKQ
jgi:hypothetical protein